MAEIETTPGSGGVEEIDEIKLAELQRMVTDVSLQPAPVAGNACSGCEYYLEEGKGLSYCRHPSLRILVSADWWCQWYEERL